MPPGALGGMGVPSQACPAGCCRSARPAGVDVTDTGGDGEAEALLRIAMDAASEAGRLLASWRR